jgi:hypothetical protein
MAEYNILKLYDSASGRIQQKKYIIRPVAESNKKKMFDSAKTFGRIVQIPN